MQCPRSPDRSADPSHQHLQDEQVVSTCQALVDDPAFEVCVAVGEQRCLDALGRCSPQMKALELIDRAARGIAAADHLGGKLYRGDIERAFAGSSDHLKRATAITDDTCDQRWVEIDHGMPGLCHDIGAAGVGGRQHYHWAGLDQGIDPRQRKCSTPWSRGPIGGLGVKDRPHDQLDLTRPSSGELWLTIVSQDVRAGLLAQVDCSA
jgi:hypothetical protein